MTPATGAFSLSREFKIAPDALWALLTDPQSRAAWGAPNDTDVLHVDVHDLQEGGRDLHRCGPKDAPAYEVETCWYRLAAPELACFSETVIAEQTRYSASMITYGLSQTPGGTALTIDVHVSSFSGPEGIADHQDGWTAAVENLTRMVAETST
ncbi:SRPBCC domain-containing protein [Roseobacteraceae bacterium S113]